MERDIAAVYRRHATLVRGRARRILGSESAAEDVTQETFMKFLEFRRSRPSELDTAAYLYRMATNLALNRLRNERQVGVAGNAQHHRRRQFRTHLGRIAIGSADMQPVGPDFDRERGVVIHKKG